ncbi:MAG: type II toxin-antitoxin system RelE/ParE family toxin [archaeon]
MKDGFTKERIEKQILRILENPEVGKPMRYNRRGTREVRVGSFRLSYYYEKEVGLLFFLDFYHKDWQ